MANHFSIGNTPKFWLGLQDDYDLEEESHRNNDTLTLTNSCQKMHEFEW
jgi:plasmid maintenance system antidote protein VapI